MEITLWQRIDYNIKEPMLNIGFENIRLRFTKNDEFFYLRNIFLEELLTPTNIKYYVERN